ncbi:MAG: restriction endonuclease subunit R [Deltaproteobacteria bacterium CG12_big_fil_rev_8_21_14_0_65_43_10]|nr:MAG: restriction endonuclease subunit R [Deltaproteobacteria bacterium CG12_big_fil_rev_8_21_14_0_65_43_10]PIU85263.1 MAG: restriction endonuclease subunit R [Deltaproteobacteria bacterium CG06_land_8_20_14_3_00_44_19]PIX25813.1 MAG: restriction endonuclease subunit R [Deltaproteobacteria bacterium CG_4_8_14_3_um_filter_43_13]
MIDHSTEADARIVVDELLRQAGWDPADKSQVLTEVSIRDTSWMVAEPVAPYGFEPSRKTQDGDDVPTGRADYVLMNRRGRPLAIIEAKRTAIEPYAAKQQALPYAKKIGSPFIFLTNGELIYFWDYGNDDARIVNSFFSRRDLERLVEMRTTLKPLATIEIPDYYLRQGETRQVRPYQRETMQALDHAVELGKRRFLIELPTGTGKTDLVSIYLKRLIQAGRAERVLFLVDREQLAKQALEALQDILTQHGSYWLRPGMVRQEQQITVCLLQTMISRYTDFTSGYFDVVIADECHRSIYGAWQTALTHFDALHIGLTATPSAYIERNTFQFYQCRDGQPDFAFPILKAFQEGYLCPYKFATGITQILAEGAEIDDETYDPMEFEREWSNEDTNRKMMQEFDRLAWENYKELAPGQKTGPGKTIIFAITKHHAARLAHYLNELHPELKGQYAEVITSDVANADDLIRKLKREEYPQVAVSVGMLDTGFDCREVLHLVMCRRVRSPILYQQMRGRGTRTADHIQKQKFVIYDFFGNHKYFNDSDTDIFTSTGQGHVPGGERKPPRPPGDLVELGLEDEWLHAVTYVEIGPEGERFDKRNYVTNWETSVQSAVKDDPIFQKVRRGELLTEEEEKALVDRLNRPEMYFNEENLRRAYRQPGGNLIDFIKAALGSLKIKPREEELTENFQAWLVAKSITPQQAQYLSLLKNRGIARGRIELEDLFQPPLSILNAAELGVELFGERGLKEIIQDLNESVFMKKVA